MSNELVLIDDALNAVDVFKPGAVEKLISDVEAKVRAMPTIDHTTEKGRTEIKALAYKITRSKTALDKMGMDHVAELKKAAGVVDADRRIIRDRLDALKDEVRKPVTEYEVREEIRIDAHKANMESLQALDIFAAGEDTIDEIETRLISLAHFAELTWEEFSDGANRLIGRIGPSLHALHAKVLKQEEERAELERLRKAEAERQEAERKANTEREQKERDDRIAAQAKLEAEERAEFEKAQAIEKAERDRVAAIETERQRVAHAAAAETAARLKREANTKHLMKINNAALADLMKVPGITEKLGKAVIVAIASGKVAHTKIEY